MSGVPLNNLVAGIRNGDAESLASFADSYGPYFLQKLVSSKYVLPPFAADLAISCVHSSIRQLVLETDDDPEVIVDRAFEATFSDWIQQLQHDVHEAGLLQGAMFPRPAPSVTGLEIGARSRAVRHINGDLHDFIIRPADTLIALVDASGKGAAAGLYAAIAGGFLRGYASGVESPSELLRFMNHAVAGASTGSMYLTAIVLSWSPHLCEISIASAGFATPLVSQGGSRSTVKLQPGLPIGLALPEGLDHLEYPELRLALKTGDWLAIFTDGVDEQPNPTGAEYGVDRLWETIRSNTGRPAEMVVEQVFSDLDRHAGATPPQDDQTFIFLRAFGSNPY